MKLLNLKSGLLLLAIGSLSACGGGGGGVSSDPSATANASISGNGVTGSASVTATIDNVDMLNKARILNGATSVNVEATLKVVGSVSGNGISESINLNESGTFTLYASDAKSAAGIPESYSFNETVYYEGAYYNVSGSYDINRGTLRTDIDVVDGSRGDFFITNEGTGTQVYLTDEQSAVLDELHTELQNAGGNYATFSDDIAAAHAEGWTGSGFELTVNSSDSIVLDLLPNADAYTWDTDQDYSEIYNIDMADGLYVTSFGSGSLEGYYIDTLTEKSHAAVAAGVGTVWNKFDTLDSQQVIDLVEATSDGKRFDLGAALSPVGNLN